MNKELIEESKVLVKNVYGSSTKKSLFYHNWKHTDQVYNSAMEIAGNTDGVTDSDTEVLALAVLFHDIAYTTGCVGHEKESAVMATQFLADQKYNQDKLEIVNRLILATKIGHKPIDLLEKIIQDADMHHIGTPDYITTTYKLLYREMKVTQMVGITEYGWAASSIDFFNLHEFYTAYAKETYGPYKTENLKKLELMVEN